MTGSRRSGRPLLSTTRAAALSAVLAVAGCSPSTSPDTSAQAQASPTPASSGDSSAGTVVPASPSPVATAAVAPARWTDCGGGFQCATLSVPLDHDDPGGRAINLSLIRMPATDKANRIGSLVVNPGGPGGSGVELVRESSELFGELGKRFDIVGFDPRGVNFSTGIRCVDDLDPETELDPNPDTQAELDAIVARAEAFAKACETRNADLLPHLSTDDVVLDLDLIRQAIGDEKLTYGGFSYGTLIGALYADRFPERVRAMALDAALDPAIDLVEMRRTQSAAFEAALGRFLDHCEADGCEFARDDDPTPVFESIMAKLEETPLEAALIRARRTVGPGIAWSAVLGAMYSRAGWEALDQALTLARAGDGSGLIVISDPFRGRKSNGSYSNQIDAYRANTCLDFPARTEVADHLALIDELNDSTPHFGGYAAVGDLPCAFWPAAPARTPAPVSADGAPPILVIGNDGDPATPAVWSESLASQLSSGVLVMLDGEGHTAYPQSECVQEIVNTYLLTGKAPADGTACPR